MKKLFIFIIAVFAANSFAISPFTYKWTIKLTGDTATVSKWKANNDSVLNWASRACDTMNSKAKKTSDSLFSPKIGGAATVDSVTVAKGVGGPLKVDSLKFGSSASYLKTYIDTTWPCTLYTGGSYLSSATARGVIIGSQASVYIPAMAGTITTGASLGSLPSSFRPSRSMQIPIPVYNNSVYGMGFIYIPTNGNWLVQASTQGALSAGSGGPSATTATYYLK
jgi:hypothetical protein